MIKIWKNKEIHQAKTKNLNQSSIDREIMSKIKTQQKMLNIDQKELSRNRMLKKRTNKKKRILILKSRRKGAGEQYHNFILKL